LRRLAGREQRFRRDCDAEAKGCRVVGIDPRYTSQRCHACGHIERANRKSQSAFWCRKCGHRHNADLNAAKNSRDKHLSGGL
jgi:putative transposase